MKAKHTLLAALLTLSAPLVQAVELSFIRGPLENAGVDSDASGTVRSQLQNSKSRLWANLRGLTAGETYQFLVDGVSEGEFVADADGNAKVEFRLSPTGTQLDLDFDPRGKELAIADSTGAVVLSMIYSGEGEPTELVVDERTSLTPAADQSGRVEARYLDQKNKQRFILHLHQLDPCIYSLRVGGEDLDAEIDMNKGRSALVVFETNKHGPKVSKGKGHKNRHSLDFDPRGELVEVLNEDGTVAFSGIMLAKVAGIDVAIEDEVPLVSTGVDPDAIGSATITTDAGGKVTLAVEIDALAPASYRLFIGGVERGTIVVTDDGTGVTHGEIVFSTEPTGTELPLDFAYAGQLLEVKDAAGVVLLSATLP